MIEEKRNYLKEFYDKKDNINYEEILRKTNNANENEINAIKKEIIELPIYIGNDDELNGIHTAWYCEKLDSEDKNEDMNYLVEMINEDGHNRKLNGKGILIS